MIQRFFSVVLFCNAMISIASPLVSQAQVDQPNTLLTKPRQLTFVGTKSGEGYFDASGTQMVFQSDREAGNPFYQIYLMDL